MDLETQLVNALLPALVKLFEGHGGSLLLVMITYRLWRRTRYLTELLARAEQRSLDQQNAMQKRLLETFTRAPTPTLSDLAQRTEEDFTLKP